MYLGSEIYNPSPEKLVEYGDSYEQFLGVAERYKNDDAFRDMIDNADGVKVMDAFGFDTFETDFEVKVLVDTESVMHVVLPSDPNVEISDEHLSQVDGGSTAGTGGTVSSASTAQCSTMLSTMSTLGTAGTAGSAS